MRGAPRRRAAALARVGTNRARALALLRRDQLDDDPGARLEGLAHHLGRAEPHSIVSGARASGAHIRTLRTTTRPTSSASCARRSRIGRPRTRRPWTKILVMVEGIYSMEGEICNLAAISAVCKKYKAYLYLDEAHSIGALGATGQARASTAASTPPTSTS